MSESISSALQRANLGATSPSPADETERAVGRLFMLFHGYWGNLFLSKFATGDLDAAGKDRGVRSARAIWSHELRRFAPEVIVAAAERVRVDNPEFPPSLPKFVGYCEACKPRQTHAQLLRIGESEANRGARNAAARSAAIAAMTLRRRSEAAHTEPTGLRALQLLVAKACALAGADEAQALRRVGA